eukprot:6199893-Pleurochrysis_carterae.AAC.1
MAYSAVNASHGLFQRSRLSMPAMAKSLIPNAIVVSRIFFSLPTWHRMCTTTYLLFYVHSALTPRGEIVLIRRAHATA